MPRKKVHRVSIYLLDTARRQVLLQKSMEAHFASMYVPISAPLNELESPVETLRKHVGGITNLDFMFLGHASAMPMVLDEYSVRIYPPFHVQITVVDQETEFVDYVYLGQVRANVELKPGGPLGWFTPATLKQAPNHVKHVVHTILSLNL